jgi:hypothetical protein
MRRLFFAERSRCHFRADAGPFHASDGASVVDAQVSQDGEQEASGREASLHAVWKDTVDRRAGSVLHAEEEEILVYSS